MTRQGSDVWEFMEKIEAADDKVKCQLCSKILAFHGGTSNLREHLLAKHPLMYSSSKDQSQAKSKQPSVLSFMGRRCDNERANKITELIAQMICRDLRPLKTVTDHGFRDLMSFIEPNFVMPSRTHITDMIKAQYLSAKQKVRSVIVNCRNVALTTDSWTSCRNQSYVTVTAHFVSATPLKQLMDKNDKNEKPMILKSVVLETREMDEKHTSENLAMRLIEVTEEYDISKPNVCAVVHDNAANMLRMHKVLVDQDCNTWEHVPCAAHTLQLAVRTGLKIAAVDELLSSCRRLVAHFRHSARASAALRKEQIAQKAPEHELLQAVATRWNSELKMLQRLAEQRWVIVKILATKEVTPDRAHRNLDLSTEQWDLMSGLIQVLLQLQVATTVFSADKLVSISCVLPVMYGLVGNLKYDEHDHETVVQVKAAIRDDIIKRMKLNDLDLSSALVVSTAVDPRFKTMTYMASQLRDESRRILSCFVQHMKSESTDIDPRNPTTSTVGGSAISELSEVEHGTLAKKPKTEESAWDMLLGPEEDNGDDEADELALYWMERCAARDSDPLEWWSRNQKKYPALATLASKYLCIPATSTTSERVFSTAGHIVSKRRSNLSAEHVDMLVFMNKNYDFINSD